MRVFDRGRTVRGSAFLTLSVGHIFALFSSLSIARIARPLIAQGNRGVNMPVLPGIFYNPPQLRVP